jgi:hypothetical protein
MDEQPIATKSLKAWIAGAFVFIAGALCTLETGSLGPVVLALLVIGGFMALSATMEF